MIHRVARVETLGAVLGATTVSLVAVLWVAAARAEDRSPLTVDEIKKALDEPGAHDAFKPAAPLGLDQDAVDAGIPGQDPLTKAKVSLGKQLYFDKRLSADRTVSCASCHIPAKGYADPRPFSVGVGGKKGGRQAPSVLNRVLGKVQFWDGRAKTLEDQALGPIANPVEMALPLEEAIARLNAIPGYVVQFERVFGGKPAAPFVARAIAAFERTVLAGNSRVDRDEAAERYASADEADLPAEVRAKAKAAREAAAAHPLTEAEKRGKALFFGKANCSLCHSGQNYADEEFYNLGVGSYAREPDVGLMAVTKKPEDWGKFKTPTLRSCAETAPYMHDGSEATLEAVVEYYDRGGKPNKNLSPRIKPLGLTAAEKANLVAFLKALSGDASVVAEPRLPADK